MKAAMMVWLAPLLLAAAPVSAPLDPALAKRLKGYTALPPQECLNRQTQDSSTTYPGAAVYDEGRRIYVNRFRGSCHVEELDALKVNQFGGQLCRGDRATPFVASTGIVRPTCVFGMFEPFEKVKSNSRGGRP
jgi:hypothetical protein